MRFLIVRKGDEDRPYGALEDINFETFNELLMFVEGMRGKAKIITDTRDEYGCKGLPFICEIVEEENA